MPASNILQMVIESKTTGTAEIDNLSRALNRLAAVGEQTSKTLEGASNSNQRTAQSFKQLGDEANKSGFNLRYAFFGLKDLAEGRTKFAIAEAANELTRLKGAALAARG